MSVAILWVAKVTMIYECDRIVGGHCLSHFSALRSWQPWIHQLELGYDHSRFSSGRAWWIKKELSPRLYSIDMRKREALNTRKHKQILAIDSTLAKYYGTCHSEQWVEPLLRNPEVPEMGVWSREPDLLEEIVVWYSPFSSTRRDRTSPHPLPLPRHS